MVIRDTHLGYQVQKGLQHLSPGLAPSRFMIQCKPLSPGDFAKTAQLFQRLKP